MVVLSAIIDRRVKVVRHIDQTVQRMVAEAGFNSRLITHALRGKVDLLGPGFGLNI